MSCMGHSGYCMSALEIRFSFVTLLSFYHAQHSLSSASLSLRFALLRIETDEAMGSE